MSTRYLVFACVEMADGTTGWGEAITQFPGATAATATLITTFGDIVVGRDPMKNAEIFRDLKSSSWWYGYRGGLASFAVSAIDIALWDLKGKLLGEPLVNLIGGAHRERLPAMASTHASDADLVKEAERHSRYVAEGFIGVKVGMGKRGSAHLGYDLERDVEFVRLLRDAVGPSAWMAMDRGQQLSWNLEQAIGRTCAFEEHDLKWIEEPFEPEDVANLHELRKHASCLIAGGEREWDARGFGEVIESGGLDIVGCDVGRAEGITGVLQVIRLVEQAGLWFNSHAWSSAVNTAASIALSASTTRCLVQELKPDESPMQHELVDDPITQREGWVEVPTRPGIGVEPKRSVLDRYRFAQ